MKNKLIALFFLSVFLFSTYAAVASKVDNIPSVGIKTGMNGQSKFYGVVSYDDNGTKYRYVLNNSGMTLAYGYPVWYSLTASNDYTVTTYESASYMERLAGIVYCDPDGNKTVTNGEYMWIIVSGVTESASVEGTTDITGTDQLVGSVSGNYLVYGRATATDVTDTTTINLGAIAKAAFTTNGVGVGTVEVRSNY